MQTISYSGKYQFSIFPIYTHILFFKANCLTIRTRSRFVCTAIKFFIIRQSRLRVVIWFWIEVDGLIRSSLLSKYIRCTGRIAQISLNCIGLRVNVFKRGRELHEGECVTDSRSFQSKWYLVTDDSILKLLVGKQYRANNSTILTQTALGEWKHVRTRRYEYYIIV